MEVSVENTGGLARRMTVQVPAERIDDEVKSRLQSMTKTVRLDGFRPGKVPLKVIEQKFGGRVRDEVVNEVANSTLQEALTLESIRPADHPNINQKVPQPGEPLEYTATFEVFPEFGSEINYNFSVSRPVVEIRNEDIDAMLDNLRRQRATWDEVDREARQGDQVNISFEGTIDGAAFNGNKADNIPLVLGSNSMIPGFEAQLEGARAGDDKVVEVTFPNDYQATEVAGKLASFRVQVNSVAEIVLPEMNDEFAIAFGVPDGSVDSLRKAVAENMERELKSLVSSRLKNQVFDGLLQNNPIDIPTSFIDNEVKEMLVMEQYRGRSPESMSADAEKRVKLGLIVSELARLNQIQVDPDIVRQRVETIAASYEKPEEVVQWYYGDQRQLAGVQSAALEDQVVEWIIEHGAPRVENVNMTFSEIVEEAKKSQGLGS